MSYNLENLTNNEFTDLNCLFSENIVFEELCPNPVKNLGLGWFLSNKPSKTFAAMVSHKKNFDNLQSYL